MKKIALVTLAVLFMLCSCESYEQVDNHVSTMGTVSSTKVDYKSAVTIAFPKSETSHVVDDASKKVIYTNDTGRYDTLVKVFEDYGLASGISYPCYISGTSVTSVAKIDDDFVFSTEKGKFSTVSNTSRFSYFDDACTVTIVYGDETIITYENLPTSPDGLPVGSLWNDGGTIKIVM